MENLTNYYSSIFQIEKGFYGWAWAVQTINGDIAAIVPVTSTIAKNIKLVLFLDTFYYPIFTYIVLYYFWNMS